jgi:hypothetical protein
MEKVLKFSASTRRQIILQSLVWSMIYVFTCSPICFLLNSDRLIQKFVATDTIALSEERARSSLNLSGIYLDFLINRAARLWPPSEGTRG